MAQCEMYDPDMMVFVDETGRDRCSSMHKFGYALKGKLIIIQLYIHYDTAVQQNHAYTTHNHAHQYMHGLVTATIVLVFSQHTFWNISPIILLYLQY